MGDLIIRTMYRTSISEYKIPAGHHFKWVSEHYSPKVNSIFVCTL